MFYLEWIMKQDIIFNGKNCGDAALDMWINFCSILKAQIATSDKIRPCSKQWFTLVWISENKVLMRELNFI